MIPRDGEQITRSGGWASAVALAMLGFGCVLITLGDPGLTVDEPINIGHGMQMVSLLLHSPGELLDYPRGKPDHPPLTRFLIGVSHRLLAGDVLPEEMVPLFGRPASALAYAVLIAAVCRFGFLVGGNVAGIGAGVSLLLMPRIFAHAHLASPEVISAAFCFLAIQAAALTFSSGPALAERPRCVRIAVNVTLAGVALGLAMATKLTAALVPISVIIAVAVTYRHRRLHWLALWGACGLATFILVWPWLWPTAAHGGIGGTAGRLIEFASVGFDRATVYTWYLGRQYPTDEAPVPWHYVWYYFATTVPLGLQLVGAFIGLPICWQMRNQFSVRLLVTCLAVTLLFFTLPIQRYDGERLFVLAFPLWAVVIGLGIAAAWEKLRVKKTVAIAVFILFFASQGVGVVRTHPCQLSYFNLATGGLAGAEKLGMEPTYWGDSLTQSFLDEFARAAEPESAAALRPTLYSGHPLLLGSPEMARRSIRILPPEQAAEQGSRWVVLYNRQSYLQDDASQRLLERRPSVEFAIDGVWLSRAYRLDREE